MFSPQKSKYIQSFGQFGVSLPLIALLVGWPAQASAQDPYHCIDELSDDAVAYRLDRIEDSFSSGRHKAISWRVGWIGGYTALASAQLALGIQANHGDRPWDRFAHYYQAAGAIALAVGLAAIPARDAWGAKRIRRQAADTPEARRAKLRYATRLLERGSNVQTLMSRGELIGLGVVYGAVGGTVKAVKWPGLSPVNTALMFIVPPVLATGTVLSAPRNLVEEWEGYRADACSGRYYDQGDRGPDLDFSLSPTGVRFLVQF